MANDKTTIELETLNGNKVYPEIDVTNLITNNSGLIENSGKLSVSVPLPDPTGSGTHRNGDYNDGTDFLTYNEDRGIKWTTVPFFPERIFYDEDRPYYTRHTISSTDRTAHKFSMSFPLTYFHNVSATMLIGNIYGLRRLYKEGSQTKAAAITSTTISSIEIGIAATDLAEPILIRKIDATEFALSDRNKTGYNSSTSQARFNFSFMGACNTSMLSYSNIASAINLDIELPTATDFAENDIFEIFIGWVQFW